MPTFSSSMSWQVDILTSFETPLEILGWKYNLDRLADALAFIVSPPRMLAWVNFTQTEIVSRNCITSSNGSLTFAFIC